MDGFDAGPRRLGRRRRRRRAWSATPTPATSSAPASSRPTCGCTRSTTSRSWRARLLGLAERRAPRAARPSAATTSRRARHLLHRRQPRQARPAAASAATRCRAPSTAWPPTSAATVAAAAGRRKASTSGRSAPATTSRVDARHHERGVRRPLPPERRAVRGLEGAAARPRRLRPRPLVPRLGRRRGGRAASSPTTTATSAGSRASACAARGAAAASAAPCWRTPSPRWRARGQLRVELGVDAEGETQPLRVYERAGMHVHLHRTKSLHADGAPRPAR